MNLMKKKRVSYSIFAFFGTALLILLDQGTKFLATRHLSESHGGGDLILWDGVFRLHYLENRGAAFGILQGQKVFLSIITCVAVVLLCWVFVCLPLERRYHALRCLITFLLAGALGNFIDRMRQGYVVDFFYFELIDFPVFNVADIYVTCSAIALLVLFFFYYREEDIERLLAAMRPFRRKT